MILVTGGAGFIGANFVLERLAHTAEPILNIDKLTYAGNLETLKPVEREVHGGKLQTAQSHQNCRNSVVRLTA